MNTQDQPPVFWTPILDDVAHALESLDDPEARIDRVLALMRGFIPYDRCALLESAPLLDRAISVAPEVSMEERVALIDRIRNLLELVSELPFEEMQKVAMPRTPGTFHVAVPITGLGETIGIVFAERSGLAYEEAHLAFLSVIAAQIGAYLAAMRAEREVRASEARFRGLYESGMIGIAFMDGNGTIADANETLASIVQRPRAGLSTRAVRWDSMSPSEHRARDRSAIREAIERGACVPYEKTLLRENGRCDTVLAGVARLESRDSLAGFVVDISAQKRLETERAGLLEERELLEMFLGMLGHDLRNPLNAIRTLAERLRLTDGERTEKTMTRILASTDRMARLVNALLDVTRIRLAGGLPIALQRVDLEQLCRRAIDELHAAVPSASIDLEVTGAVAGLWDGDRLLQVVSNLLTNALQHGRETGRIKVRVTGTEAMVELTIQNAGAIPKQVLGILFQPFRRASVTDRGDGLGLGLFITRHVIEAHGGSIEVVSSEAEGTTFTVRLPRRQAEAG